MKKAIILISHGSRAKKAGEEMQALVANLQSQLPNFKVVEAYMEIQTPTLEESIQNLVTENILQIDILPLFFFTGRHMQEDIPQQVEEAQKRFPNCAIKLLPHIGSSEAFVKALVNSLAK